MIALVPRDSLIGVIIGPVLWAIYFVASYLIGGIACTRGFGATELGGINAVRLLLLLAGAITALLIVIAGVQAERGRRRAQRLATRPEAVAVAERERFLYATALVLCLLSLVGTVWLAMSAVIAPVC